MGSVLPLRNLIDVDAHSPLPVHGLLISLIVPLGVSFPPLSLPDTFSGLGTGAAGCSYSVRSHPNSGQVQRVVETCCDYSCRSVCDRTTGCVAEVGRPRRLSWTTGSSSVCSWGGLPQPTKHPSRRSGTGPWVACNPHSKEPNDIHFVLQSY